LRAQWRGFKHYYNKFNTKHIKQVAGLFALVSAVYTIYKIVKKNQSKIKSLHMQGNEKSSVKVTTPEYVKDEKENVWYNKTIELVPADLPEASRTFNDFNQFKSMVSQSTALLRITNETSRTVSDGQCFNIYGNMWITNLHNVDKVNHVDIIWIEMIRSNGTGVNRNVKMRFDPSMYRQIRNTDLVIIEILGCPPGKNFLKFVPENSISGVHNGVYISRTKGADIKYINLQNIQISQTLSTDYAAKSFGYASVPNEDTHKGESGSVLIVNTPQGPVICGLHQAGAPNMCISVGFIKSDFSDNDISDGTIKLSAQGYERALGDLHPKSVPRWVETGNCNVYGTLIGFRPKPKSHVQKSYICETALNYGYELKHGPPVMSGWEPWNIAFEPMVNMPKEFKVSEFKQCTDAFIRDVKNKNFSLGYLSDYESVNGIPGVKYIDGLNRNTSMGHPWCSSKKNFLEPCSSEEYPDGVTFGEEIWKRVRECETSYLNGECYRPVFTGHLKDEPVSFKKIASKKTRVFAGAPVDWSLVVRKALLPFIKEFQQNRELFEAAPGLNCQSTEWHNLFLHMTKFGTTNFVAGDYANFDKSMLAMCIMEAFRFIYEIHELNGCTPEHLKIIKGIAKDVAYSTVNFNGDLIQFFGSNPSGHPLTVVINSIVNALYMRFVYAKLNPKGFQPETFKENVILMTYGDDNFMNVKDGCEWFNHTSIQACLAEHGIKYTMADKEAKSIPYISIHEVSFLKRTFRYDNDLECYLAPLEHDSINKMLTIQVKSKSVSPQAQALSAIQSAIREYFFYGKEEFNKRRALLRIIIEESGLDNYLINFKPDDFGDLQSVRVDLPTWEELVESFHHNSK